jgi:uncharacterized membrane protein
MSVRPSLTLVFLAGAVTTALASLATAAPLAEAESTAAHAAGK